MPFQIGPKGNLNWFIKEDEIELIQFQKNKFIHNWRKIAGKNNPYPRFEKIIESYSKELTALNSLYEKLGFGKLIINQCELIYINVIKYGDFQNDKAQQAIFSNNNFEFKLGISEYNFQTTKVLKDSDAPIGRLYTQVMTGMINGGEPAIHLQYVCRGAPANTEIGTSLDLITKFRSEIVKTFTDMTSEYAHQLWGRKK